MLSFFDSITGSYALALLFYALIFKIVLLPFSIKQQKNQIKMAKLAPQIAIIRAKYKGRTDQVTMQKMNQEIMAFQQKEGASPMSGCLPLLIQLPIIMLLYTVIQNPLTHIAKYNDNINNYNENYKEITVDSIEDDELLGKYYAIIEEDRTINKADTVVLLYRTFHTPLEFPNRDDEEYYKEKDDGTKEFDQEKYDKAVEQYKKDFVNVPSGSEIKIINEINAYVNAYPSNPEETARRIEIVNSFGINYDTFPHFELFGANMAQVPSFTNFSIITFIPFFTVLVQWLTMFITRKLNPTQSAMGQQPDGQAKASMLMMDIPMLGITLWMAFSFSAMLGLYWAFQSMLGLGQMFVLSKIMPLPKFTEEEIKDYQKKLKEAEKAAKAAAKSQPKHRSLHYIDEDDYDVLPEVKTANPQPEAKFNDVPDIKD